MKVRSMKSTILLLLLSFAVIASGSISDRLRRRRHEWCQWRARRGCSDGPLLPAEISRTADMEKLVMHRPDHERDHCQPAGGEFLR